MFALGVPATLSQNPLLAGVKVFGKNFFDLFDFMSSNVLLPVGGLAIAVIGGWLMSRKDFLAEMNKGCAGEPWHGKLVFGILKFITPILIGSTATTGSEVMVIIPFTQGVLQTVLAQFANSPALLALLNSMNVWVDPAAMLAGFWLQCLNIATATSYGLDRIGRVVGVRRTLNPPDYVTNQFLFFKENVPNAKLFGPAAGAEPFWDGSTSGSVLVLPDSYFRTLIYVKAMSNISGCSAQALNHMVSTLFAGSGNCYWLDLGAMQAELVFTFDPGALNFYILNTSGAMPRPAGVALSYSIP